MIPNESRKKTIQDLSSEIFWAKMSDTVKRITIEGFKSIRKLENFELRGLNVLIGANGAGKSNFVEFLRVLRELVNQRLQTTIGQAGGADAFLYLGPKITRQIVGKITFGDGSGYEFTLVPTLDNRFLLIPKRLLLATDCFTRTEPPALQRGCR